MGDEIGKGDVNKMLDDYTRLEQNCGAFRRNGIHVLKSNEALPVPGTGQRTDQPNNDNERETLMIQRILKRGNNVKQ